MTKTYTISKKKKLVAKIHNLKAKSDFIKIYNIIKMYNNIATKETNNSTYLLFDSLTDNTYEEIEKFLKQVTKRDKKLKKSIDNTSSAQEYKPYAHDEFPVQKDMCPKLKYSNREKNILKKTIYDKKLAEENGSDVIYRKFNVDNLTDTDYGDKDN